MSCQRNWLAEGVEPQGEGFWALIHKAITHMAMESIFFIFIV